YGDSTNESPSEQGVVSDSLFVLSWTLERVKGAPLFVWGHSLGTSVSSHSLDILSQKGLHPTGLILEAPFNNMRDEIREHPLARVFRFLPWFDFCFADSVGENNLLFETDKHLRNIRSRVLILHAEDDKIIPFKLAKKLYESTVQGRSPHFGKVKFVKFEEHFGLAQTAGSTSLDIRAVSWSVLKKLRPPIPKDGMIRFRPDTQGGEN
ncbi:unnamed protein product, partial [Timema podura]|nr:unnamed protein product [Timema podura]